MISNDCLSNEWINEISAGTHKIDKILVEKVIRALRLLEGLAETQLKFSFTGIKSLKLKTYNFKTKKMEALLSSIDHIYSKGVIPIYL